MTIVPAFPIPCSLSGKSLQYSTRVGKCGFKFWRRDQQELCWMTPELEPIIPKGSGVGLVIWETICWCRDGACVVCLLEGQFSLWQGDKLCFPVVLVLPRSPEQKGPALYQGNLSRDPIQSSFSSRCSFLCEKKTPSYRNVVQFNLLESLQCLGH